MEHFGQRRGCRLEYVDRLTLTGPIAVSVNRRKCNPIAGQILVCNESYGNRGWLGIASIWLSNGHISQGTTKLNDTYFNQAQYNTPAWRAFVACPGNWPRLWARSPGRGVRPAKPRHLHGLHQRPRWRRRYSPSNEHPNAHDYAMLNTIYNHDDGFDVDGFDQLRHPCGWTKAASRSPIRRSARRQPGRMGPRDPSRWAGRPDVFEQQLGSGRKVITHVFWAIGEGPKE